jgi:flagellar assembly factor FliW
MPLVETKYCGTVPYGEGSVFEFPHGLPAFEGEKAFILVEPPERAPLIFLQSMALTSLCFVAFPIQVVDENYHLAIAPEDLEDLGLDALRQPVLGNEALVLAVLSLHDEFPPTANLMAPIVLNLRTRRGLQAIRRDFRYSHAHPVGVDAANQNATTEAVPPEAAC